MDLTTTYMGLELKNPIVHSSSPLTQNVDNVKKLEDANAAAIVMFSIFEEQIKQEMEVVDHFSSFGTESYAESLSFFPSVDEYAIGPDNYIDLVAASVEAVDIPVIGSINGITNDSWIDYAKRIEQAGAAGLELNIFYVPTNLDDSGQTIERMYLEIVAAVKQSVKIPIAVKLNPFFSSMAHMASQLDATGADALVLFNRFYQPDFDLENLEVIPTLELSDPTEIRLPLLWISVLYGKLGASLAATTGVHSAEQVIKYLMAGADITMTTSALLKHGPEYIGTLVRDLELWMTEHEYESVTQMKGSMSQQSVENPAVFERANYIKMLKRYKSSFEF